MPSCCLIICEKTSHWAAALRLAVGTKQPQIVETRSLAGCEAALAESPASLVAVEITTANIEAVMEFVVRVGMRFPRASIVAFLTADALSADGLMREAGAIDVASSVIESPRVARLARRQFALVPQQQVDFHEFLAERIPWPAHATA